MLTGSHIPDDRHGIKFNKPVGEVLKADEEGIRDQVVSVPRALFDDQGCFTTPRDLPPADATALRAAPADLPSTVANAVAGALAAAGAGLLVVALAQPRRSYSSETVEGEGIDIMIALDISGSMQALDFAPKDRLEAAKDVTLQFIAGRPHDRIGLVVFAAKAFTQFPLTLDHPVLIGFLDEIQVGLIEDGTAIGLGLATGCDSGVGIPGALPPVHLEPIGRTHFNTLTAKK